MKLFGAYRSLGTKILIRAKPADPLSSRGFLRAKSAPDSLPLEDGLACEGGSLPLLFAMARAQRTLLPLAFLALLQQSACTEATQEDPDEESSQDEQGESEGEDEPTSDGGGTKDSGPSSKSTSGTNDPEENSTKGDSAETSTQDESSSDSTPTGDPGEIQAVCKRWKEAFADKDEGSWSGNVDECNAGDIEAAARQRALDRINFIRWLTKLKEVKTDPAWDKKAQACALMMHANGSLSHNPPKSWKCYSEEGAAAAAASNISGAPGVSSVLLYMIDPGNATTIGHRRWIISNRFGPTGLGSTSKSSCMYTFGGETNGDRKWTAWPPPGIFPIELNANSWTSMDSTGWTIQSDTIAFSGKTITVKGNGKALDVSTMDLLPDFGARNAVKITPKGWKMKSGTRYEVEVEGTQIKYTFEATTCKGSSLP